MQARPKGTVNPFDMPVLYSERIIINPSFGDSIRGQRIRKRSGFNADLEMCWSIQGGEMFSGT